MIDVTETSQAMCSEMTSFQSYLPRTSEVVLCADTSGMNVVANAAGPLAALTSARTGTLVEWSDGSGATFSGHTATDAYRTDRYADGSYSGHGPIPNL
ncbi:MAG: hypothetical protein ABR498_05845 [Candidatus Dormibacteria bacterium]